MVQNVLPFTGYQPDMLLRPEIETAQVVGLRCEDRVVTIRFLAQGTQWGESVRQISLDRQLAEQLSRLLADELEDYE
jgi:hypothetical protein